MLSPGTADVNENVVQSSEDRVDRGWRRITT